MNLNIYKKLSIFILFVIFASSICLIITLLEPEYKKVNQQIAIELNDFQVVKDFIIAEFNNRNILIPYQQSAVRLDITNQENIDDFFPTQKNNEKLLLALKKIRNVLNVSAISLSSEEKVTFFLNTYKFSFAEEKYMHSLVFFSGNNYPQYNFLDSNIKIEKMQKIATNWYYVIIKELG